MNKTQLIEMLEGPASAEFTFMPVSKVVELIKQLEEAPSTGLNSEKLINFLDNLQARVVTKIGSSINSFDTMDVVDKDSAEFSINYNNVVEIESIDCDLSNLEDEIVSDIESLFDDVRTEIEEEEKVEAVAEVEA